MWAICGPVLNEQALKFHENYFYAAPGILYSEIGNTQDKS
jgi:hypothetical protein